MVLVIPNAKDIYRASGHLWKLNASDYKHFCNCYGPYGSENNPDLHDVTMEEFMLAWNDINVNEEYEDFDAFERELMRDFLLVKRGKNSLSLLSPFG